MLLDVFNEAELKFMDEKLIAIMVKILNSEQPFDVLETCVDSLHDQAANGMCTKKERTLNNYSTFQFYFLTNNIEHC